MTITQKIRRQFKGTDKICSGFILNFDGKKFAIVRYKGHYTIFNYSDFYKLYFRNSNIKTLNQIVDVITDYDPDKDLNIEFNQLNDFDLFVLINTK